MKKIINSTEKFSKIVKIRKIHSKQFVNNFYLRFYAKNSEKLEPETLDWIDSFKKNSIFYDIGASIGIFSIYAALKQNCNVCAFEPEIQNFSVLGKNHFLNRKNIQNQFMTFNIALGNKKKISELYISRYESGAAMKILSKPMKRLEKTPFRPTFIQNIMQERLDDFVEEYKIPYPNHIKIDVDGSEHQVIKGAEKILSKSTLKSILIEIEETGKYQKTIQDIENKGFSIKDKFQVEEYKGLFNYIFVR